jgi:hypothetical protein
MNESHTVADSTWLTAMVEHEGHLLALRVRPTADTAKNRTRYPRLAVITHALAQVRPNGLPVPDYNDLLVEFDVAVVEALEKDEGGLAVLVETLGGRRNYYAYVAAAGHAELALASVRQWFPEHQLSLKGGVDSEWRVLNEYRKLFPWVKHVEFPDDENGDVLRRMAAHGADLHSPRIIDFEHRFPDAESARAFQDAVANTVLAAFVHAADADDAHGWQVRCRVRLIPTHDAITETELRLATVARTFGGVPDGWGSLSKPDGAPAE